MSKHTPGPWQVCDDGVSVFAPNTDTAITNAIHPCAPDHDEAMANAVLIAAAPDTAGKLAAAEAEIARLRAAMLKIYLESPAIGVERIAANALGHKVDCVSLGGYGLDCSCGGVK